MRVTGESHRLVIMVFLVEDHELFASGVRTELEVRAARAGTVEEAVLGVLETEPDVVLLDVHLPDGSGARVVERELSRWASVRKLA